MNRNEIYNIHDYKVLDLNGKDLGTITGFWVDETTGQPEFASVKTGWLFGKNHVIPIRDAHFDYASQRLRVPYQEERIKDAPSFSPDHDLSREEEQRIYQHFRLGREREGGMRGGMQERERAEIPLREEKVDVGKREVTTGQVRLRKVVETETKEVPVELRRERVEIERLPPNKLKGTHSGREWKQFGEGEIVMTERAEEPVINKHTEVVGGVRATKDVDLERRDVRTDVRREDIDVERDSDREPMGRR